jgi:1-acyl-sn-glycerol-3-phosphate acyltransferase
MLGSMIQRLAATVASLWMWLILGVLAVLILPLVAIWRLVGWPVDRWNYLGGRLFRLIAVAMVGLSPRWRFEVRGTPPANPRNPYVVVANHESFADIVLLSLMPWEMKWLSKVSIMKIPVFGWIMWLVRDVPVHRGRATSARAAMEECAVRLRGRVSVMIFPEGTRSRTAEMLPFKDGAFRLAIEAGVPVLPIALFGTRRAIARRDWRIGEAHAVAEILDPVPTTGMTLADVDVLKAAVREVIRERRDALREELRRAP